jgi:glycosyltransferase involved in cell wall biosynthesis
MAARRLALKRRRRTDRDSMPTRAPKVSVVMPSYNHAQFVGAAVESVLKQSFEDLELCITDDGSTDGTPDVIAAIGDDRIRFARSPVNRGVSATLNDAIRRSTGEYIAVLNSDDIFLSDKLRAQVELLDRRPELGVVFGYPSFIDERDVAIAPQNTYCKDVFFVGNRSGDEWLRRLFQEGNCFCHPSSMIRRKCHDELGLYDERLAQLHDLDLWLRVLMRYEVWVVPEPVLLFRILGGARNASAPRTGLTRTFWEQPRVMRRYVDLDEQRFDRIFGADLDRLGIDRAQPRAAKLAWLAVDRNAPWSVSLALELFYDLLGPQRLDQHASIGSGEFVRMTGFWDLYGLDREMSTRAEYAPLVQRVQELERSLSEGTPGPAAKETRGWLARLKGRTS